MTGRDKNWQPVEPGHVIPAGQPYMFEVEDQTTGDYTVPDDGRQWFVDSSWRPPLELPTEPTWGIAYIPNSQHGEIVGLWQRWREDGQEFLTEMECGWDRWPIEQVTKFIRLTPDQVERIEQQS